MFLKEYVEALYEQSVKGSADFMISEYLLMHIGDIPALQLSQIARETGLPKSTVSYYFCSDRIPGGFTAFKSAIKSQLGLSAVSVDKHMEWITDYFSREESVRICSAESIRRLADLILNAKSVVLIGPYPYRASFLNVMAICRRLGIPVRYMLIAEMSKNREELENLSEDDLVIFLSPDMNYTEFKYKIIGTIQISEAFRKISGKQHYICFQGRNEKKRENVTFLRLKQNPYSCAEAINLFGLELFVSIVRRSGIDSKTNLFVR